MNHITAQLELLVRNLESQEKFFTNLWEQSPPGSLQKRVRDGKVEYVHAVPDPGDPKRSKRLGITRDPEMVRALADKEYARRALPLVRKNLEAIRRAWEQIEEISPDRILSLRKGAYRTLPREMFSQIRLPAERRMRQRQWSQEPYDRSDYRQEDLNHKTSRGLYMRSRSEVLIAEKLYEYDIPFRYEQVIPIGRYTLAPDFTFLDRHNDEFYLEYCGLMDDAGYANHQVWREGQYRSLGIVPWRNMIYIYDANDSIDMEEVEWIIVNRIRPRI